MSEYQYYEFRAIDRPLTNEQRKKINSLSSRAEVTSHQAKFTYHYADFQGDEEELMETYFDVMLYIANWGSRRLMFRLPSSLVDIDKIDAFSISDEIACWLSNDKQSVVLDLNFNEEEPDDWIEGEELLNELIDLREELIQGDFRVLYLAWLKATQRALEEDELDEETLEPPVPYGLKNLSNSQKNYINFLDIDEAMIAVASQKSEEKKSEHIDIEQFIEKLPEEKKYDFLLRLSREEQNLSTIFNRYLHELATQSQSEEIEVETERRTLLSLMALAKEWEKEDRKKRHEQQEIAQKQRLELLAKKKDKVWKEIYKLIDKTQANAYDEAVQKLKELRELSQYQNEEGLFKQQVAKVASTYSRRQALLRRMRSSGLIN